MQPYISIPTVRQGRVSARDWLIHWLAEHGPTAKHEVVAAFCRYCWAVPTKQAKKRLEQAFQRAKRRCRVTGDNTE
jgi:hypothetical protein